MQRSESRILITHTGSLPRPKPLVELQLRMSRGEAVDPAVLAQAVAEATRRAVERQLDCGIDVGNDGEQPRESFFTYVRYRMSGFGEFDGAGGARRPRTWRAIRASSSCSSRTRARACTRLHRTPSAKCATSTASRSSGSSRNIARFSRPSRDASSSPSGPRLRLGIVACGMQDDYYGSLPAVRERSGGSSESGVRGNRCARVRAADRRAGSGDGASPPVRGPAAR